MVQMIIVGIIALIIGALIGYIYRKNVGEKAIGSAEQKARNLILDAENRSESIKKEALLEAKEEAHRIRSDAERDARERRQEVQRSERRMIQKEESLDRKIENIEKKEESITQKEQSLINKHKDLDAAIARQMEELERISGYTVDEAKAILLANTEKEVRHEASVMIKEIESKAKEEADKKAKNIITNAIQRCAADHVAECTVSVVALPNDEMKGRIIGREGRNIKSMEQLFGVSLIIDDTPETLTVSCFDPIRREKAKLTLEALIHDGRIQPGRIEDLYNKISTEFDDKLKRIGEQTIFKLGLPRINAGLYPYLGRLKYRTSYGQNVLDHSIQVAYLASVMASELGLDPILAKRAGLLHDIGKSIDAEQEGSHVQLGAQLAKKFNEPAAVINAIESHHGDVPKAYLISEIVTAADTLSAARPGARSETLETYIKRLEQLETICKSFTGVQSSYALQSGRDVRVMVVPEKVSDEDARVIAQQIRDRIQDEMQFPGQIKVSVIRETRAIEIAK